MPTGEGLARMAVVIRAKSTGGASIVWDAASHRHHRPACDPDKVLKEALREMIRLGAITGTSKETFDEIVAETCQSVTEYLEKSK
jgi:predicted Rossmann fold nucleotide-binding protein DprA/Smf involved in DNA uptake